MHEREHHLGKFLAAAWLALAVACGGGGPETEPAGEPAPAGESETAEAPSFDVCELLTAAEVEEALGRAPGDPVPEADGLGACSWPSSEEPDSALVHLTLSEATYDSYEDFIASYLRDFGEEPSRERHREVEGIGEWAMFEEDENALLVHMGERVLEITVHEGAGEEEATALARNAAPRLPESG